MIRLKAGFLNTIRIVLPVLLSLSLLAGCSSAQASTAAPETASAPEITAAPQPAEAPQTTPVRVLLIPKFEIGGISGDFPGEAQLFYERYCAGCGETQIDHMPPALTST